MEITINPDSILTFLANNILIDVLIYLVFAVLVGRIFYRFLCSNNNSKDNKREDEKVGAFFAAILWPLFVFVSTLFIFVAFFVKLLTWKNEP